ncbi:hypothetical protein BGZ52_009867, partial [Haplosporangium bisporale]
HLGVDLWPALDGTDDTNEMTQPLRIQPQRSRPRVGVVWILLGSGNIMDGKSYTVKLCKAETLSTSDMLAEAGVEDKWRYMKTCDENPKRVYGQYFHTIPSTRLGESWLLRD